MSKRVALYARVSTDDQRGNYSIPTQISESLEFVESQGYSVVGSQFVDPVTGTDRINGNGSVRAFVDDYTSRELSRPSLDAAIAYLEKEGFDTLLVHSLDRLARDPYIRQTIELELAERGANVEYVLGNYDDSPEGEIRKDLDATFAKWENAKRVERSQRGKRGKAERGLYAASKPPYGYQFDKDSLGGLAIDDYQANVVRRIFDLYSRDESVYGIARTLTSEGALNYSGKARWAKSSINRILHNTAYLGTLYYNKTRRNGREVRDPEEWIEIKVLPIIEQRIFDDAQARIQQNKRRRRREPKRLYLLSGMVICVNCERPYGAEFRTNLKNGAQVYRHRIRSGHCCNHQISARKLDPAVWDEVVQILLDPDSLKRGYEKSLEQQEVTYARQRSRLKDLHTEKDKLSSQQENLLNAYTDPDVGLKRSEFIKKREAITGELEAVVADIAVIEDELAQVAPPPPELETIETFAFEIAEQLKNPGSLSKEERRQILHMLRIRVLMGKTGALIEGWVEPRDIADGLSFRIPT